LAKHLLLVGGGHTHMVTLANDIQLGGRWGVLHKKCLIFNRKLAFKIKDYMDRKFMNKFQEIEKKCR
jgi:hypothetical protein